VGENEATAPDDIGSEGVGFPEKNLIGDLQSIGVAETVGTVTDMATNTPYATVAQRRRTVAALGAATRRVSKPSPGAVARFPVVATKRRPLYAHGIVRLDDCGRLRDVAVFTAVGFVPGVRVSVSILEERAVVVSDDSSAVAIDVRGRLSLSETQRKLLGVGPGDAVVLSGNAVTGAVVIQPTDVLDGLVV
jgi:hypothetical protein